MHKNEWVKHYNSLYLGRVPRINGSVWHMNPRYVVKTFDQQLPLSLHLVDMNSDYITLHGADVRFSLILDEQLPDQ